jgi:hypothetical protein
MLNKETQMAENFDIEKILFKDGELSATLVDTDNQPNKVIEKGSICKVVVDWWLTTADPWVLNGTTWYLDVYAESIGAGPEPHLAHLEKAAMPADSVLGTKLSWKAELPIDTSDPANNLPDGAYKMAVVLTHKAKVNGVNQKTRMAGFYEISMVQIYTHEV